MFTKFRYIVTVFSLVVIISSGFFTQPVHAKSKGFVSTDGTTFMLDGKPFYFLGTNNYYLHYKSHKMIDDVLTDAARMNLKVIRLWGFLDGDPSDGIVLQPKLVVYNEDGFERFDYAVAKAKKLGIKLVVPLTNNWQDFGGMQQYVDWESPTMGP